MSQLVEGKIPVGCKCPYKSQCTEALNGHCGHMGIKHTVPYSCGYARLFAVFEKRK